MNVCVEADKSADDTHVDDVCSHGRDTPVTEEDALHDTRTSVRMKIAANGEPRMMRRKRPAHEMPARAHRDGRLKDWRAKMPAASTAISGIFSSLIYVSRPAEGESDEDEGDEPVDCALRDGDECVGNMHGVTSVSVTFFNYCSIG